MNNGNEIPIETHDLYTAAFADFKGIEIIYRKRPNGRVTFILPAGQETANVLATYNSNPQIPALDFVQSLRKVRAKMIALRS
jgi:hypothetical protein